MGQIVNQTLNINVTHQSEVMPVIDPEVPNTGFLAGISDMSVNNTSVLPSIILFTVVLLSLIIGGILFYRRRKSKKADFCRIASAFCLAFACGLAVPAMILLADANATMLDDDITTNFNAIATENGNISTTRIDLTLDQDYNNGYKVLAYMTNEIDGAIYGTNNPESKIVATAPAATATDIPLNSYGVQLQDASFAPISIDSANPTEIYSTNQPAAAGGVAQVIYTANLDKATAEDIYTGKITLKIESNTKTLADISTMQEMTPEICAAETTPAAGATAVPTKQLIDVRDNKIYTVAKLADGNCWMTQNLALGSNTSSMELTSDTSDVPSTGFVLPQSTAEDSWVGSITDPEFFDYVDNYDDSTTKYGNYYNWPAATAGVNPLSGESSYSICPANWRLPTGGFSGGELEVMMTKYGYSDWYMDPGILTGLPLSLVFSGTLSYDDGLSGQGYIALLWSSTANDGESEYAFNIYLGSSGDVGPSNYNSKHYGLSIRCMAHRLETRPTITYDANGGTGTIVPQTAPTASEFSQDFILSDGAGMTKANHVLIGWSTDASATEPEYDLGGTIATNSDTKLYAVWYDTSSIVSFDTAFANAGKAKDPTTKLYRMQDMSSAICDDVTTISANIIRVTVTTQLVDMRDNKVYSVSKLADGNCWMTQNLALGSNTSSMALTPDTSDVPLAGFTLPQSVTEGDWMDSETAPEFFDYVDNHDDSVTKYGNYYNWPAATAGTGQSYGDSGYSICPANWRLPTGGLSDGEFEAMLTEYGYSDEYMDPSTFTSFPLSFVLSGNHHDGLYAQGESAYLWSSTTYAGYSTLGLQLSAYGDVYPASGYNRGSGLSIRCVAR